MLAASLGILWFVLCRHLSSEWSLNEQYSYGWFVPFFAVYLFWLRWEDRPDGRRPPEARRSKLQARTGRSGTEAPVAAAVSAARTEQTQATRLPLQKTGIAIL